MAFEILVDLQLQLVDAVSCRFVLTFVVVLVLSQHSVVVEVAFPSKDLVVLEAVAELALVVINNVDLVSNY